MFQLVLKKRGPGNAFVEVWRIELDPADVLVHRESAMFEEHVVAIHNSGDPATKVDLLLMGDGYTADEQDDFIAKAVELTNILFATSPFKERKDDFNIWAVAPPAARVRCVPSINEYIPRFTDRCNLRCISLRALRADIRQQVDAPHRVVSALRFHRDTDELRGVRWRRHLRALQHGGGKQ